ncbi:type VI secretion system lipoprotein TssJ [Achromobacter arsenitoxydans]|uniref:type VI secretion system lipoprotein TssJ n=1 Tax=Achromobacter arsenitoxydans TaxID=1147684 RepID=UPI001EE65EED|nr:type VI secretion system lipoprotein TssJ [Achromobacter arsenitoxydans]
MHRTDTYSFFPSRSGWSGLLALLFVVTLLPACASKKEAPEKTVRLAIAIEADERVNADAQGRPAPIQVQLFELKSRSAFEEADFFSLQSKPRQVLGADLAESTELVLRPTDRKLIKRRVDGQAVAIGVIAGYRDLGRAVWRATYVLPPRQTQGWFGSSSQDLKVQIKVGADTVSIAEVD